MTISDSMQDELDDERPACQQKGCTAYAVNSVFWPGQETKQCVEHTDKLVKLGSVMGFSVSTRPLY